jgi:hypothetical protein
MCNKFVISAAVLTCYVLLGCSTAPQDKTIAKIGNTALFASDAEFLAAIRPESARIKQSLAPELQQVADTRRLAEVARTLFAGNQNSIQKEMASSEDERLAQIYSYFYLQANLGHTNKSLLDYYKKNENRYAEFAVISEEMAFINLREKIAADLFLQENPELAAVVNDSNKTAIIDSCRREKATSEFEKLKKLYKAELVKLEPPNIEEYYNSHPEEFQIKAQYKLLSLSDLDSLALANKMKKISTREDFAKIAASLPFVKQGHAIMDIGMFPSLDAEVSQLGAKKFTKILRAPDTQAYYVFYIDSIIAPQLKPWDRAKDMAKFIIESKGDFPLDSSYVLATLDGKPYLTEKDVLELREKVHPMRRASFRREMALNSLLEKSLYAKAAKEKGLDKSNEHIAWTRRLTDQAYVQVLMDSLLTKNLGVPEDSLLAAYEAEKDSLFLPAAFEDSRIPVAIWLRIPEFSYKKEFILNRKNYGDATNWESVKRAMYKNIRYREFANIQEREIANLQKSVPIAITDTSWGLEFMPNTFAELAARAKTEYENRNLQKTKSLWEKAKVLFVQDDSAQKTASSELANVYQELNLYDAAVEEYKVIAMLWPNDPEVYKAYFMQGFILSEYQKQDSLALKVFEEMIQKFPNSELSEDAKIMIENIKSGGKVFEDLIKKIESSGDTQN